MNKRRTDYRLIWTKWSMLFLYGCIQIIRAAQGKNIHFISPNVCQRKIRRWIKCAAIINWTKIIPYIFNLYNHLFVRNSSYWIRGALIVFWTKLSLNKRSTDYNYNLNEIIMAIFFSWLGLGPFKLGAWCALSALFPNATPFFNSCYK